MIENISFRKNRQLLYVVSILFIGFLIALLLLVFKPDAERHPVDIKAPQVDVIIAQKKHQTMTVYSQGDVEAVSHIMLSSEVSGKVVSLGEKMSKGAFFKKGDLLLKIDDRDYQLAVVRAKAQVAAAEQQLNRSQAEAKQAKKDLSQLSAGALKNASPYALREPQLKEAEAKLKAAKADLSLAELQLNKTVIAAPFDGRVLSVNAGMGQIVSPSVSLSELYQYREMQVSLPVSLKQLDILKMILGKDKQQKKQKVSIELIATLGGKEWLWPAYIHQLGAEIDRQTQLINLLVKVDQSNVDYIHHMLLPGLFVEAKIKIDMDAAVFVLPRQALRNNNEVWLLDENNQLKKSPVNILFKNKDNVFIDKGIRPRQKIIVSLIDMPVTGMLLRSISGDSK